MTEMTERKPMPDPIAVLEAFGLDAELKWRYGARYDEIQLCQGDSEPERLERSYCLSVGMRWLEKWKPYVEARAAYYEAFPDALPRRCWQYLWAATVMRFGPAEIWAGLGTTARIVPGSDVHPRTPESEEWSSVGAWSPLLVTHARAAGLPVGPAAARWASWLRIYDASVPLHLFDGLYNRQTEDVWGLTVARRVLNDTRRVYVPPCVTLSHLRRQSAELTRVWTALLRALGLAPDAYLIPVPGRFPRAVTRGRCVWCGTAELRSARGQWNKCIALEELSDE